MGIESSSATASQPNTAAALPLIEQPRIEIDIPVNQELFERGSAKLLAMGLDPERIAKLVVGSGRVGSGCTGGTLAEMMMMPDHADKAETLAEDAREAARLGIDPTTAVFAGLKYMVKRDENTKQFVQARVRAEGLKKNRPGTKD